MYLSNIESCLIKNHYKSTHPTICGCVFQMLILMVCSRFCVFRSFLCHVACVYVSFFSQLRFVSINLCTKCDCVDENMLRIFVIHNWIKVRIRSNQVDFLINTFFPFSLSLILEFLLSLSNTYALVHMLNFFSKRLHFYYLAYLKNPILLGQKIETLKYSSVLHVCSEHVFIDRLFLIFY